ncbi:MAG: hypothetical protein Kow0027_21300 [Saprospiraceae bacterium]
MKQMALTHPELFEKQQFLDNEAARSLGSRNNHRSSIAPFTLPVVVHIIHQGATGNISDAQVLQGIQHLNEAYSNTGYYDQGAGVNTQIQFCLAKRSPEGTPTTGINRVESPLTSMNMNTQDLQLKNLIRWDPLHYINIWLVNEIQGGVAGYAYLPAAHGTDLDGIVMEVAYFGSTAANSSVQIHEMGHYLGLYHTFQNGCTNNDCLNDGDKVCDTPPDNTTVPVPCDLTINSCSTDTNSGFSSDQNDMFWNYMDYGNLECYSAFTQGQTDRMHFFIENVRYSLLESKACQDPCLSPISAGLNTGSTNVTTGTMVSFSNQSTGATNYQWYINGTLFSTAFSPSYFFDTPGTFTILLQAYNNDPNCSAEDSLVINVSCNTQAVFNSSNLYPAPGETVTFTNISTSASSYAWSVNGTLEGSSQDFTYTFSQAGAYTVCLDAEGAYCNDEFCQLVFVQIPDTTDPCESGFLMFLGEPTTNDAIYTIIPTPEGNILLGGYSGNKSLLSYRTPNGGIIWEKKWDFTNGNDFISLLKIDSDGNLIVNGRDAFNSAGTNFFFKYDYHNQITLWSNIYYQPAYSRFMQILEHPTTGNYIFPGLIEDNVTSLNNAILEYDRNNGALNWSKTYDAGGTTDVWNYGQFYQGNLYTVGVERYGGLDKIKASFSKLTLSGQQVFTKIQLKSPNETSRLYGTRLYIHNDTAFILARGSMFSSNLSSSTVQFYTCDLNGEIFFAYNYDISGGNDEFANRMIELPDGFAILGRYFNLSSGNYDCFIYRIKKDGSFVWAKGIDTGGDDLANELMFLDGFIYFSITTEQPASQLTDILIGKINLDGILGGTECPFVSDLTIYVSSIPNPYSA